MLKSTLFSAVVAALLVANGSFAVAACSSDAQCAKEHQTDSHPELWKCCKTVGPEHTKCAKLPKGAMC
ncbi:hypothetical protein GQ42DRAFT_161254 [Ramicandelaber brevisporus]|nr:hypothetical protein GQ42DRAFT_161254 [Ramicandelaber brevisporus]